MNNYYAGIQYGMIVPSRQIYFERYGKHPNLYKIVGEYDADKIKATFNKRTLIGYYVKDDDRGYDTVGGGLIEINPELCLEVRDGYYRESLQKVTLSITILYSDAIEIQDLTKLINVLAPFKIEESKKGRLNILCKQKDNYYLREFNIDKPNLDVGLYYNDGFDKIHDIILKRLIKKDNTGIVILHGEIGTGKTTYIRHLIHLIEKEIIFVPPTLVNGLSDPEFLPFLAEHTNAILIVEDSENVVGERGTCSGQGVSNLLNLSDGLLGDCLKLQIITTFNVDIAQIDKALLRKGRLIAKWHFKELESSKVQKLAKTLGMDIDKSMTLANLFNYQDDSFEDKKKIIGILH